MRWKQHRIPLPCVVMVSLKGITLYRTFVTNPTMCGILSNNLGSLLIIACVMLSLVLTL
jgi:hypothetical protein